jgi:Ca2+-transporting ATPase
MGITGTEVAKEAADIILLDDNFSSLVKAVIWGRSVYDSIRKYLQFQLSVTVSAVSITIITSIYTTLSAKHQPESALEAVQLLWVNLIMGTLAALALATDPPQEKVLNRPPCKKKDSLINSNMISQIVGQSLYQIISCLVIFFKGPTWLGIDGDPDAPFVGHRTTTLLFNTYIFCQVFNEINCRNITKGFCKF